MITCGSKFQLNPAVTVAIKSNTPRETARSALMQAGLNHNPLSWQMGCSKERWNYSPEYPSPSPFALPVPPAEADCLGEEALQKVLLHFTHSFTRNHITPCVNEGCSAKGFKSQTFLFPAFGGIRSHPVVGVRHPYSALIHCTTIQEVATSHKAPSSASCPVARSAELLGVSISNSFIVLCG